MNFVKFSKTEQKPEACNYIKIESPEQVFPVNFAKFSENLLYRTLPDDCF